MRKITTLLWLFATGTWLSSAQAQTPLNNALDFDGTNDHVTAPANPAYDMAAGTFECWVKPNGFPASGNPTLFSIRSASATRCSFHLNANLVGLWNGTYWNYVSFAFATGTWYHLAFVCTAGNTAVYINGAFYQNIARGLGNGTGLPLNIGAPMPSPTGEFLNGTIDEVRIWNTVRTAAQIRDNMYYSLAGNEPGLVGLFSFNQGNGGGNNAGLTTAIDGSTTKNNATLQNFALTGSRSNWVGNMVSVPTKVNAFSPASGNVGTTVTITGNGFDTTPESNAVMFGATRAIVTTATTTSLTVLVPAGASFDYITVTNLVSGRNAASSTAFLPTFRGNGFALGGRTDYNTGNNPLAVLLKDFEGDGRPELANPNMVGGDLQVFQNTSSGTVSFAGPTSTYSGFSPTNGASSADMNGDGKPDVVIGVGGGFVVHRNTSGATPAFDGGTFTAFDAFTGIPGGRQMSGGSSSGVALADLDGDGQMDVVVADMDNEAVWLFRNTSAGNTISFAPAQLLGNVGGLQKVAASDLDGDGKPEVLASGYTNRVTIYRNNSTEGQLSFFLAAEINSLAPTFAIAIGDLNDDGRPDIAFSNMGGNYISVALNNGNLSFGAPQNFTAGLNVEDIAIGDLNGDGRPDLATANSVDDMFSVLLNTTSGNTLSFAPKQDFATSEHPTSLAIGDLNGDGRADIAVANLYGASLSVYSNLSAFNTLPVKLAGFEAQKQNKAVKLTWRTATENNTLSFTVEQSADGNSFSAIGTVAAAGSSASVKTYSFDDVQPLARNYYRLKQIDKDGSAAYSSILLVDMGHAETTVSLAPQPVRSTMTVTVSNGQANSSFQLFNLQGNKVRSVAIGANGSIRIERKNLPAGLYVYRLTSAAGEVLATGKVLVQ